MAEETTYRLRIPSRTENLEIIREFVSRIARNAGFSEEDVGKIQLAVDEACTNVVKHAYDGDPRKPIDVAVRLDYDRLTIVVTDEGKGFDPKAVEISDISEYLAELRVGGLGIYLMRSLMDEVEYSIQPGVRNQVRMVKYFVSPAQDRTEAKQPVRSGKSRKRSG
ncbi:MAG: ATP-binding protein [candidate division KSB1 bacterium]|nr:ATP-binding protein [candidate division KSB1 bacterium]